VKRKGRKEELSSPRMTTLKAVSKKYDISMSGQRKNVVSLIELCSCKALDNVAYKRTPAHKHSVWTCRRNKGILMIRTLGRFLFVVVLFLFCFCFYCCWCFLLFYKVVKIWLEKIVLQSTKGLNNQD